MKPLWTIVSDDLTGLQAIAGEFARLGLRVGTGISRLPTAAEIQQFEVYGFDTATRPLPGEQAQERVANAVRHLLAIGAGPLLKHNDSILQGHIGLELQAIASARGARPIVYAPACPNRRRVTRDGIHMELDESGASVRGGLRRDLRECVSHDTGLSTAVMDAATLRAGRAAALLAEVLCDVLIADAESDADLDLLVAAAQQAGCRVLSGSVGLAAALARAAVPKRRFAQPVVVVAGSLQAATQRQVERLLSRPDCAGVRVTPANGSGAAAGQLSRRMREVLAQGLHCTVWTPSDKMVPQCSGVYPSLDQDALTGLHQALRTLLEDVVADMRIPLGGLVVAGGTTADLTLRDVLRITQFTDLGWLCEGMTLAVAADGVRPGLPVITKSGGWGAPGALSDAIDRIGSCRGADALVSPTPPLSESASR
jgi:D-threonate/D-erythronate kinase